MDLLRTDAFVRMGLHLRFGTTDPRDSASDRAAPWRFDDPLGLAELVLGDPLVWSRETLRAAVPSPGDRHLKPGATGETRTIRLRHPVPVLVLYWTASVDAEGALHFYPDVYGRDDAILARLDATPLGGTLGGQGR